MKFSNHFGLDIGSHSVKVVQLSPAGENKFKLLACAVMNTPNLEDSPEKNVLLAQSIKKFLHETKISEKKVAVSLPESQVYTRVVEMPYLEEPELTSAIRWQAEQYIPVPLADVVLKHQVISVPEEARPDAKMRVLLVAAPNPLVNGYLSLLSHAGLEVVAMETEILAVIRALTGFDPNRTPSLLINLGQDATIMAIVVGGDLVFTQTIGTGGLAMTRAVATDLGLEVSQAEQYKKTYGLAPDKVDGKVAASLKPVLDVILADVRRAIAFYQTHQNNEAIRRVILSGGSALTPDLVPYFLENLGLETQLADPFAPVVLNDIQTKDLGETKALFTTAVGLAEKET